MALITANIQVYGDTNINVWTAPLSASAPAAYPAAPGVGWGAVGWLDADAGIAEDISRDETEKYGMQGNALLAVLRSKEKRPVSFTALEENPVTAYLLNPFGSTVTVAGTAEVQTITITGSPTGGTFDVTIPGYGAALGNVYNVTTTALGTALSAALGFTVGVTGTAGSSYVMTFPAAQGNVPQASTANNLTGGTTPSISVATGTPGTNPVNTTQVKPVTGRNLRQFAVDLVSSAGIYHRRWYKNAEAIQSGTVNFKGDDFAAYAFNLNPYLDVNGSFYVDINNNPQLATGLFV